MAEFLTTKGTSYHIEKIIIEAKKELFLVSPYLQLSKTFYERLRDASLKGISIKIIYGKDDLKPNERDSLANLENVQLYYFENLHAKCYFSESQMVITSMNMYEFSEVNNREMGVLIIKETDKDLYEKAHTETISIIQSAEPIRLRKTERIQMPKDSDSKNSKNHKTSRGYCIRCEARIEYNPKKPYCAECYSVWAVYENPEYLENVCHKCGQYEATSMTKPLDYKCYQESQRF